MYSTSEIVRTASVVCLDLTTVTKDRLTRLSGCCHTSNCRRRCVWRHTSSASDTRRSGRQEIRNIIQRLMDTIMHSKLQVRMFLLLRLILVYLLVARRDIVRCCAAVCIYNDLSPFFSGCGPLFFLVVVGYVPSLIVYSTYTFVDHHPVSYFSFVTT